MAYLVVAADRDYSHYKTVVEKGQITLSLARAGKINVADKGFFVCKKNTVPQYFNEKETLMNFKEPQILAHHFSRCKISEGALFSYVT